MKKSLSVLALIFLAAGLALAATVVVTKTANYDLTDADDGKIICVNSASALTMNLPGLSSGNIGFRVTFRKQGAGNLTIQAPVSQSIADGASNGTLVNSTATETYASVTLVYAIANKWHIESGFGTWATSVSTWKLGIGASLAGVTYNGLTLTSAATGYTIAGGTASRTLTVDATASISALAPLASPSFTGTVTLPTSLTGFVKAASGIASAGVIADGDLPAALTGKTYNGASIKAAADPALAAEGVLETTIASGWAGILVVKEVTAGIQYFLLTPTGVGGALATNAAYSDTKDNALTVNVYAEGGVFKIQNKTALAINVGLLLIGF